jgi:hypothetical protein
LESTLREAALVFVSARRAVYLLIPNSCGKDIARDLKRSSDIRILCVRAFSFTQRERPFSFVLQLEHPQIKILCSDPGDKVNENKELLKRANSFQNNESELYRREVISSVAKIQKAASTFNNIELRLHKMPACHRIFLTDRAAYLSFFCPNKYGSEIPITRIRAGSLLYAGLKQHFDQSWETGRVPGPGEFALEARQTESLRKQAKGQKTQTRTRTSESRSG